MWIRKTALMTPALKAFPEGAYFFSLLSAFLSSRVRAFFVNE